LETLSAVVCWVDRHVGGVEFERPLHPAVFAMLVDRLALEIKSQPSGAAGNSEGDDSF
jgi:hypothetical protein